MAAGPSGPEHPCSHEIDRVLVLGCGYSGAAIARLARSRGLQVLVNVRNDARADALRAEGFDVFQRATLDASVCAHATARTHVVIAFPPDGTTDASIASTLRGVAAVTYISTTGVYGEHRGLVNDETPLPVVPSGRSVMVRAAEEIYRALGGTVLRCPALYGSDRGLHVRVVRGEHRIPGDGTQFLSRIHVDDLAQLVLRSGSEKELRGAALVVGDLEPAPHVDVVRFICDAYGVPLPPFVPLSSVHESLRADRRVDATRALTKLGVTLRFPSYRDGMAPTATRILR